jgi:hypothetical protein
MNFKIGDTVYVTDLDTHYHRFVKSSRATICSEIEGDVVFVINEEIIKRYGQTGFAVYSKNLRPVTPLDEIMK